jgi:YkoY family integral membrane protein
MNEAYLLHAISVIGTLIVLEGLLSADNALVLAVLVKHLPKNKQKKALLYGIVGAFVFRFIMLVTAAWIIKIWYLCAAGALYLAHISFKHFLSHSSAEKRAKPKTGPSFWRTVITVELTDVAFAIDSVVVAVALSRELWLIYTGGMLGIIAMRFAAGGFLVLLERYPGLEHMAYALVGWIAVKLGVQSYGMLIGDESIHLTKWVFWTGMGVIAIGGGLLSVIFGKRDKQGEQKPPTKVETPTEKPGV